MMRTTRTTLDIDKQASKSLALARHTQERASKGLCNDPLFEHRYNIEAFRNERLTGPAADVRDDLLAAVEAGGGAIDIGGLRHLNALCRDLAFEILNEFAKG